MASTWWSHLAPYLCHLPTDSSAAPPCWANEKQLKDVAHTAHHYPPWQPPSSAAGQHRDQHRNWPCIYLLGIPTLQQGGKASQYLWINRRRRGAPGLCYWGVQPCLHRLRVWVPDPGAKVSSVPRVFICRPCAVQRWGCNPRSHARPTEPR